ncbi:hypothetical protein Tco_0051276 [Tanacetum coccineum]
MTSPNKPTSKPSMVAKMSVKPIRRKKLNPCNTSNKLNVNSPTPMPKPLTPYHEPSQENNHNNKASPNTYIKDTPTSPQVISYPPSPIPPTNSHVTHTQAPPQSDNQTQHTPPLSPSRESLVDDINQLQNLSNLLDMHLSQQQNNIPSSPYSPNLPHTLNINQVETHVGLEEEKACRRGKVYNLETATYGKVLYDEDVHDLRSAETEFPAIVYNDALTSEVALSYEPTVSPLNDNQIDFRLSFDESDDEDYTVIYDKNSFSYKIIYVDDLKMDSENDNVKVNMPSFPSSEPTVSYFDDFDYFKNFEKEFPAITYNDALTSKLDLSEPIVSPQHIDEFDETLLSECDGEEQNVIYFNDLFPFNVIYPNDLLDKDNDNDKINIEQSSVDLSIEPLPIVSIQRILGYGYGVSTSCTVLVVRRHEALLRPTPLLEYPTESLLHYINKAPFGERENRIP